MVRRPTPKAPSVVVPQRVLNLGEPGRRQPDLAEPPPAHPGRPVAPHQLDAVLLPLVSFDGLGGRLGTGGGFYDRYFADTETRPWMIGVAYSVQESLEPLPTQPWDIPLDAVVTESGYRIFDRATLHQH
ncbi:MAG: hypothetical protein CMD66_02345 [Gammaproteobacteria bacterium]|nr:hypothetical protein [Gammaproteobacteria bacterium]